MEIYNPYNFNYTVIRNCDIASFPQGNRGSRVKRRLYKEMICAFDTETSYIKEIDENILYVWQAQIDEYFTVIGRTVTDLMYFFLRVNEQLEENEHIIFFVHNLSYDWQFIRCLYDMPSDTVFAVKSRRILKCDILEHIELRCSYLQTNLSLDQFTKKMNVAHQKQSGAEFDYSKVRYPDTPLTDTEIKYIRHDVIGLVEAIKEQMRREGDCIYTLPLTSTGYVRRDVKRVLRQWNRQRLQELFPSGEVYQMLREEFRGGNTHANRYYVKNPDFPLPPLQDVKSADRSSSYPDVIVNYKFPMTPFRKVNKTLDYDTLKQHYIIDRGYAVLTRITFYNIRLKDKFYPCPYISSSKCTYPIRKDKNGKLKRQKDYLLDNGRILKCRELTITVNDIDLKIIEDQYEWKQAEIHETYFSRYDYLPDPLRDLVKEYYKQKTELKGIAEQQVFYDKFKNLINSIYGCMAQDPAKERLLYHQENTGNELFLPDGTTAAERLEGSHPTQPYQWGCWVTSHARFQLERAIKAVHESPTSNFVYADTDSVKYIGVYDWTKLNAELTALSKKHGAYAADTQGKVHYMGVFEIDGIYKQFQTMGAKSYIYTDDKGLHITIAGVPKEKGALELQRIADREGVTPFDLYKDDYIFTDGITLTTYHDRKTPETRVINGHEVTLTSNLTITPNTHQIGITAEYNWLLNHLNYNKLLEIF